MAGLTQPLHNDRQLLLSQVLLNDVFPYQRLHAVPVYQRTNTHGEEFQVFLKTFESRRFLGLSM